MNLSEQKDILLDKFKTFMSSPKRNYIIILLGIVIILSIAFSNCSSEEKNETKDTNAKVFNYDEYSLLLEEKIEKIVENIEGAGKCSVMITLEKTEEYVFFTEEKISTNTEEETGQDKVKQTIESDKEIKAGVVENRNNGNEVLITTTIMPQVGGVVVICEGGGNVLVQERVTNAVATALNISYNKVFVTKKQR